ncbi:GGDEF domain-containing protein [Actinoplanes sp. ATCC 53533]|uniref:GGDEF domain-containing protein n=1 Tax=Actinoplanes sp. ATCC 53533 TaxID=1288362 RepID=UPI000F7A68C8|nr:GGDEF domain-containing protein [Actinoplanes sp. ATCC 53533]RSM46765.1 GGDEF domain-containing protein [Actinoplanes sp. ATCC 53533]
MTGSSDGRAELVAALTAIEDQFAWVDLGSLQDAVDLEESANALGEEELAVRARICQAKMWMRMGEVAATARRVREIQHWGVVHGSAMVQARAHLLWANVHRHLGDLAAALEHSLLAVELLDDTATPSTQIWHRAKLADALGQVNSMDEARLHYQQSEDLATTHQLAWLRMAVLNNWAYMELTCGFAEAVRQVAERLQAVAAANGFELDGADLDTIANIQVANGQFTAAERTIERAIARDEGSGAEEADSHAEYLLTLTAAQRGQGAGDRAQASLDECRALCVERELGEILVRVQQAQADLYADRGEFAAAFETHREFFAAYHRLHSSQREAQARNRHAMFETTEARQDAERFREQARRDPLTGLRNRRYVDEQLPLLIGETGRPLAVAIVDLDHFKRINDLFSHHTGDRVLVRVAELLEAELTAAAPAGFVARLGGEEFLVVLPGISASAAAEHLDRIRKTLRDHDWRTTANGLSVTVSIGVAEATTRTTQAELLACADRHLYTAKRGGRDQVVLNGDRVSTSVAA